MYSVIYAFDCFSNKPDFYSSTCVKEGESFFTTRLKDYTKFGGCNLRIHFISYLLKVKINTTKLKTLLEKYIYEPEVCNAIIWVQPGVKTYFFFNEIKIFITDISQIEKYIKKMGVLFSLLMEEDVEHEVPDEHETQETSHASQQEEESGIIEDEIVFVINGIPESVNIFGEIVL